MGIFNVQKLQWKLIRYCFNLWKTNAAIRTAYGLVCCNLRVTTSKFK